MVRQYFAEHPGTAPTKKQHLAAIRGLFDRLVNRRAVRLNPAAPVRVARHQVTEGQTPEIAVVQARKLLKSVKVTNVVGLRDRAAIAVTIYSVARMGAVAKLKATNLEHDGTQWRLRCDEKGGGSRLIPARHNVERFLKEHPVLQRRLGVSRLLGPHAPGSNVPARADGSVRTKQP